VKVLLESGANVHVTDDHRWTPLHEAYAQGYEPVVKVL
jgi:ankyrin repeat protein